jgi:hypothetical protein
MRYKHLFLGLFLFSAEAMADSLYQAEVGGYVAPSGIGLGSPYTPYSTQANSYFNYSGLTDSIYYDNFTYPHSTGCCGCNQSSCNGAYSSCCH